MNPTIMLRFAFREIVGAVVIGVTLFWSAGQIDWLSGWVMIALSLMWSGATAIVIVRINPALLYERLGPRKDAKRWDTVILSVIGITTLGRLITAGLDQRYGWTDDFSPTLQIMGLVLVVLGYALVVWATASNAFFSQVVRIQSERGHAVVTSGPYRIVRHPAYVGALLLELTIPIWLASWWAFIPGLLNAIFFIIRTMLEDNTLQTELNGYVDYALKTHYRLLPGIW